MRQVGLSLDLARRRLYLGWMTTIRTLELQGFDPRRWGEQHGEAFRDEIRQISEIRVELTLARTDLANRDNLLALARHHLPLLQRFDAALYEELLGIARASGVSAEEIVVANHYTDLRDLRFADLQRLQNADPGGCSAMFLEEERTRLLMQTWDMHGSAEPFALLLKIPALPDGGTPTQTTPAGIPKLGSTVVFTIAGCLGMTGLSSWGVGLTINNLNSLDATVGIVWPALVRKALRQPTAIAMRDLILSSPIGSGRHYILADDTSMFGIETSGTRAKIIQDGGRGPYFHTNHCIDDEMKGTCRILPGSSTIARYDALSQIVERHLLPTDLRSGFDMLAAVGLPHNADNPHDVATCGALAMDLSRRNVMACVGIPGPDADSIVIEVR